MNGHFDCGFQVLTDFKGVKFGKVSGDFRCENNQLTTLEGAPQIVGKHFYCSANQLTSLEGAPHSVGGDFYCSDNQLTSLEGAPHSVGVTFYCNNNQLTTLEGAPQRVGGAFYCNGNQLTSLVGAPQIFGGYYYCGSNPVSSGTLKGIFELMKNGMGYQQAVDEFWPEMGDEDRAVLYKQMTNLSPEDIRKYKAMTTYSNIKNYL